MRALNSTSSILIKLLFYIYRSLSNVTIERENVNKSRLGILIQYITVKSSFSATNSIQIGVIVDVPLDLSEVLFIISITACEFHVIVTNYIKTSVLREPHYLLRLNACKPSSNGGPSKNPDIKGPPVMNFSLGVVIHFSPPVAF